MSIALRGLLLGLAFGLATTTVELGLTGAMTMMRRFGVGAGFLLQTAGIEMVLAAGLGLAPLPPWSAGRRRMRTRPILVSVTSTIRQAGWMPWPGPPGNASKVMSLG